MDAKYESLFTPWKIGNVEIKNRIVMCPMGGTSLCFLNHSGSRVEIQGSHRELYLDFTSRKA